ncbi:hypothetical protein [Bacillus xiapuensis]|uniref:hypothetical protein n=1 Tax=Bacillus xiapuensis TaxID=2014075 RepID=UPI000C249519|nr:hypothetical protein [Bacillus xiapuensis]
MFDPAAFDNIKFIIHGEVYDRDLAGLFQVHERKDAVDLATMSRESSIVFSLNSAPEVQAAISIQADVKQLAGELMQLPGAVPGVTMEIIYSGSASSLTEMKMSKLEELWGKGRLMERKQINSSLTGKAAEWHLHFNRIITEEMMDEMAALVGFIADTLQVIASNSIK